MTSDTLVQVVDGRVVIDTAYNPRAWVREFLAGRRLQEVRFFTPAWHSGELPEQKEEAAVENYRQHLEGLRSRLSPQIQQLAFSTDIHDGLLEEVTIDHNAKEIRIRMISGDLGRGYSTLQLTYRGVRWNENDLVDLRRIAADPAAEALHDEVDVSSSGLYEHRVLFWPYRETRVEFQSLELSIAPRERRDRQHPPRLIEI